MNLCIIGGTSGLGLGLARAALEQNLTVTVAGRDQAKLDAVKGELGCSTVKADATEEGDVARLFTQPFDHVVLTTVAPYYEPLKTLDFARARALIDSRLTAALLVAKHARIGTSLTLTSGIASKRPAVRGSVMAAVNGAIDALVRQLALELAPIRVNAISPGWVDTPVWDKLAGAAKADTLAARAKVLPVGRIGAPSDIAQAFLFVMNNGYTTGQTLYIDGGHQLV